MFILTTFRPCEGCIYVASGASEMDERISTLKRSIKEYGYKDNKLNDKQVFTNHPYTYKGSKGDKGASIYLTKYRPMKKKKFKFKKKKPISNKLKEYNAINYLEDYRIIGQFCNLPKHKKEWIEDTREALKNKANKYEMLLGEYLINSGIKFVHQAPFVINGKIYFLDFFIPNKRLAIEVDGQYHSSMYQEEYDNTRDDNFKSIGIKTIRIGNNETLNKNQLDIIFNSIL